MSNRDELAEVAYQGSLIPGLHPIHQTQALLIADRILAAGHVKHRTITTIEELDALPVGSVVLHGDRSWQRYKPRTIGLYQFHKWQCPDGGIVREDGNGEFILPAIVLHEGVAA